MGYSGRWPSGCQISKVFYCHLNFVLLSLSVKWYGDIRSSHCNISTKPTAQSFHFDSNILNMQESNHCTPGIFARLSIISNSIRALQKLNFRWPLDPVQVVHNVCFMVGKVLPGFEIVSDPAVAEKATLLFFTCKLWDTNILNIQVFISGFQNSSKQLFRVWLWTQGLSMKCVHIWVQCIFIQRECCVVIPISWNLVHCHEVVKIYADFLVVLPYFILNHP